MSFGRRLPGSYVAGPASALSVMKADDQDPKPLEDLGSQWRPASAAVPSSSPKGHLESDAREATDGVDKVSSSETDDRGSEYDTSRCASCGKVRPEDTPNFAPRDPHEDLWICTEKCGHGWRASGRDGSRTRSDPAPSRVVSMDDPAGVREALKGMGVSFE